MNQLQLRKDKVFEQKRGLVPIIKGMLFGGNELNEQQIFVQNLMESQISQNLFQFIQGHHTFNRKTHEYLIEVGYAQNPIVFGIINAIIFAQKNIVYSPYWKGKPYKSKTFELDTSKAFFNLCTTGTAVFWDRDVIGFGKRLEVIDTVNLQETYLGRSQFKYKYQENGVWLDILQEDLIFKKFLDNPSRLTNFGLSPLQAAVMPIEALREMYTADTSLLKNKGSELLISNGSQEPFIDNDQEAFDAAMNKRIAGAKKFGKIATSTANLQVHQLGRTIKELALWDGYKVKTRDICVALNYPSTLAGDTDASTLANYEQSERSKYTGCVIPIANHLFGGADITDRLGYEVFCDTSNIECLQEDQNKRAEKAQAHQTAILDLNAKVKDGTITNEIAVNMLVMEWQYDEEEARKMIMPNPVKAEAPIIEPQPATI